MELKKLSIIDSDQIANLHSEAFKNFFLTSLGKKFLSAFYKSILKNSESVAIGLFLDNDLKAFAVGTLNVNGFYFKILVNNFFTLLSSSFFVLIFKPNLIFRIIQGLTKKDNFTDFDENPASLLSICVSPLFSDKGFGSVLLNEFESEVYKAKRLIILTTDSVDNNKVNSFYTSKGYKLYNQFYQGKRKMNFYIKYL
jgi:ribosomal protein S18 acetylase RimI-like enzyme